MHPTTLKATLTLSLLGIMLNGLLGNFSSVHGFMPTGGSHQKYYINTDSKDLIQIASAYIATRHGIPVASLKVLDNFRMESLLLSKEVRIISMLDNRPHGIVYKVLVDVDAGDVIEDEQKFYMELDAIYEQQYGKLNRTLY